MASKVVVHKRSDGAQKRNGGSSIVGLTLQSPGVICPSGYHRLADAPEVAAAVWWISDLISSMPIHLMQNGPNGDSRIRDALARKVDIEPYSCGTRQTFMGWVASTMLLEGDAFVLPKTSMGTLQDLVPMPGATAQLRPDGTPYEVVWRGLAFDPSEVLHFPLRPDPAHPWRGQGLRVQLQTVVDSIMQTAATKQSYMSSEYKPPIIIAVNADSDLATEEERNRFIDTYIKRDDPSKPIVIPADLMTVSQVKPLSLTDLAIKDGVELDKRAVASIVGVPPYVVGFGGFDRAAHNAWISTRLLYLTNIIRQELTKKLLYSDDRYFAFNSRALYAYDLSDLASIGAQLRAAGLMTGNEVRNWIGLTPKNGLDDLIVLENYIPTDMTGNQKKLTGGNDK